MKYLTLLLSLIALASCESGGKKQPSPQASTVTSVPDQNAVVTNGFTFSYKRKVEIRDDLSNLHEFLDDLNTYVFSVIPTEPTSRANNLACRSLHTLGREVSTTVLDSSSQRGSVELQFDPDFIESDTAVCWVSRDLNQVASVRFTIKKSVVVQGHQRLSISLGGAPLKSLVLLDGSELVSAGVDAIIDAEEIVSQKGSISTWDLVQVTEAPDNKDGLPGGHIQLNAKRLVGELDINLRGQNGGAQTYIPPAVTEEIPRDNSLNGRCDSVNESPQRCSGKPGHQGLRGRPGRQGNNGGNSGSFTLVTDSFLGFSLNVHYIPGHGGVGGQGGSGGPGQPGGFGATVYFENPDRPGTENRSDGGPHHLEKGQRTYPAGAQGAQGETGDMGDPGENGVNDVSEIRNPTQSSKSLKISNDWSNLLENVL